MIRMYWTGDGIAKISAATRKLSNRAAYTALRRAVNHTGAKTFTAVRRSLAKQVGATQRKVTEAGGLRRHRAGARSLDYVISSRGGFLSLKDFNPRQSARGVLARPWGARKLFDHAFMGPRPGVQALRLKGHVFARTSDRRLPIRKLWGPAVPREMTRNETAAAFEAVTTASLPARVEHEITAMTRGVVSR